MKKLVLIASFFCMIMLNSCSCGYNNLVTKEEQVNTAFADVQTQYQRRADLIPNLVNTVKGEANFEKSTLEAVIQARASATQMKIDPKDLTPEKLREFQATQGQLSQALGRLIMVSEQYPTLQANGAFRNLQTELAGTENRINASRRDYNAAVQSYNVDVRKFPNNLTAGMFGFKPKTPFAADAGAQNAPKVNF